MTTKNIMYYYNNKVYIRCSEGRKHWCTILFSNLDPSLVLYEGGEGGDSEITDPLRLLPDECVIISDLNAFVKTCQEVNR